MRDVRNDPHAGVAVELSVLGARAASLLLTERAPSFPDQLGCPECSGSIVHFGFQLCFNLKVQAVNKLRI